jgi:hypothetical protein
MLGSTAIRISTPIEMRISTTIVTATVGLLLTINTHYTILAIRGFHKFD